MKISKSKKELARIISENGGWYDGAEWAAQDKLGVQCNADEVAFYKEKPQKPSGSSMWNAKGLRSAVLHSFNSGGLLPNWHQTLLSRDEFDQIVAETAVQGKPDADGWIEWKSKFYGDIPCDGNCIVDIMDSDGEVFTSFMVKNWRHWGSVKAYRLHKPEQAETKYCESAMPSTPEPTAAPTIDQLLQDWRNADDFANRKQAEADEAAAMRDEKWQAVQARAGEMGVTVGLCENEIAEVEPELVITDYHKLRIGDVLRCKYLPCGAKCNVGDEGVLKKTENTPLNGGVYVEVNGIDWFGVFGEHWEFIRRP